MKRLATIIIEGAPTAGAPSLRIARTSSMPGVPPAGSNLYIMRESERNLTPFLQLS